MYTYKLGESLYINLTNQCTNNCVFCIRNEAEGVGYDLWLNKEPSAEDVINEIGDPKSYSEIVFCGYGEPTIKLHEVVEISKHIKNLGGRTRLNTNGHGNIIWGRNIVPDLAGIIDEVSISLNAKNTIQYEEICKPEKNEVAFEAIIDFTRECKKHIPAVSLTVVDVISAYDIELCRGVAADLGVDFRVRHYH